MLSTQGFSPALFANPLQKSRMVAFGSSNKFVGMKLGFLKGILHKVVSQAHKNDGHLEEIKRQMEQMKEDRVEAIKNSIVFAEKRLDKAIGVYEAAKEEGNMDTADLEFLDKKVDQLKKEVEALKIWYHMEAGK